MKKKNEATAIQYEAYRAERAYRIKVIWLTFGFATEAVIFALEAALYAKLFL